jgi:hypothetical protein
VGADPLTAGVVALVSAFCGSYLGAYLKKKGENLATQEDINNLVAQVQAVTTATKEIEAKISNDMWSRQKRWELKREALFEMAKCSESYKNALVHLYSTQHVAREQLKKGVKVGAEHHVEARRRFNEATDRYDEATLMARLSCGVEAYDAASTFGDFMKTRGQQLMDPPETLTEPFEAFVTVLKSKIEALAFVLSKQVDALHNERN